MRFITLVAGAVALALSLPAQQAHAQSNDPRANDSWIFCDAQTEEGERVYTPVFRGNWHSDIHGAFESRVRRQWTPVTNPEYCHYWLIRDGGSREIPGRRSGLSAGPRNGGHGAQEGHPLEMALGH